MTPEDVFYRMDQGFPPPSNPVETDPMEITCKRLPADFPTLVVPAQDESERWNAAMLSKTGDPLHGNHSVFFPTLGHFCKVAGDVLFLWNMDQPLTAPVSQHFDKEITSVGIIHHSSRSNILVISCDRQIEFYTACFMPWDNSIRLIEESTMALRSPETVICIKAAGLGRGLLGTRNGHVYLLTVIRKPGSLRDHYTCRMENLSWEITQMFQTHYPVKDIHIDQQRQLAYALHTNSEIQVFSLESGIFSSKRGKIADYKIPRNQHKTGIKKNNEYPKDRSAEIRETEDDIYSIHALPEYGFGNCVLMGCSSRGKLFYFWLKQGLTGDWELATTHIAKRIKTTCGFGLDQNINLKYTNTKLLEYFFDLTQEGCIISIVGVIDSTILLDAYQPENEQSTLIEVRLGVNHFQNFNSIYSVQLQHRILGMAVLKAEDPYFKSFKGISERIRTGDELTKQMFYSPAEVMVYTAQSYLKLRKTTPAASLMKIIKEDSKTHLQTYMDSYSEAESVATALFARHCRENIYEILLKTERLVKKLEDGILLFLQRLFVPIWISNVFVLRKNKVTGTPRDALYLKLDAEDIKFYLGYLKLTREVIDELQEHAGVYFSSECALQVKEKGLLKIDQAQRLKQTETMIHQIYQLLLILQELKSKDKEFSIETCTKQDNVLRVSEMSFRDFVSFGLHDHAAFEDFMTQLIDQMGENEGVSFRTFLKENASCFSSENSAATLVGDEALHLLLENASKILHEINKPKRKRKVDSSMSAKSKARNQKVELFNVLNDICSRFCSGQQSDLFKKEFTELSKHIRAITDEAFRRSIVDKIVNSSLCCSEILCLDSMYSKYIETEILANVLKNPRCIHLLTAREVHFAELLKRLWMSNEDKYKLAELYATLAIRREPEDFRTLTLKERARQLEKASDLFEACSRHHEAYSIHMLAERVKKQGEIFKLIKEHLEDYELIIEDNEYLAHFESRIAADDEIKDLVDVCFNDGENRLKVFEEGKNVSIDDVLAELKERVQA